MFFSKRSPARCGVANRTGRPRAVYIEPWGEDYTLLAEEELEVIAFGASETTWFSIVDWPEAVQVYIEGPMTHFEVRQAGVSLQCGHQRQVGNDFP